MSWDYACKVHPHQNNVDRVAVMAYIESVFYQVIVPDCDSSFLRFLEWENGDLVREL